MINRVYLQKRFKNERLERMVNEITNLNLNIKNNNEISLLNQQNY